MTEREKRFRGTVLWYTAKKKMGFIKPDEPDASDIFVHDSDLRPGTGLLSEGDAVEYGLAIFRGRNKAVDVILVGDGAPAPPSPAPSLRPRGDALDRARVTGAPLSHDEAVAFVTSDDCGAVATFLGVTRDTFEGRRVRRLEYEGYAPMAEREMLRIGEQARARWELKRVRIVHRVGVCPVGEASVVIAASAAHRREALEAVAWAIDTLKASVPIWKKEFYDDEGAAWKENKEWARGAAPAPGA